MEAHRIARRTGVAAAMAAAALLALPMGATALPEDGTRSRVRSAAAGGKDGMTIQSTSPRGWLDLVDGNGVAGGWTCDPDDFSQPLWVHFYLDGPAGSGTFIGAAYANLTREPAVGDNCGGWRNHGYRWTLPSWLWDGHWHTLWVHAINIGHGDNVLLAGSGFWFRLGGSNPQGWLDLVDDDGVVHGWTCDPDDFSRSLYIHFYVDGSFVGDTLADRTREPAVGSACGGWRNHGYGFILPEWVRDGQWRTLSVWAINVGPGHNVQLGGSPAGFRLNPSLEPEGFAWEGFGVANAPSRQDEEPGSGEAPDEGADAPARREAGAVAEPAANAPAEEEPVLDGEVAGDSAEELDAASQLAADASAEAGGGSERVEAPEPEGAVPEVQKKEGEPAGEVMSTRCEWHSFGATFRQTRYGWQVVVYKGYFRVCYVPNDRIVSVSDVHGDASWICSWCGWRWLGNANGYPNHTNFGSRLVLRYRGTAQFCPPQFWCIGTRQPWVEITFFPNGTKRQVIGVG